MGKRKPIHINGEKFNTKTDLRNRIRALRDRYDDGVPLDAEDFNFMLDLLQRHEDPNRKIGCGVWYMYVKTNPVFKRNRGFWLVRTDGTETDFSFEICLKHQSKLQKVKSACRSAIVDDVLLFRNRFFDLSIKRCEITGEEISKHNCHIDHKPPMTFERIFNDFIQLNELQVDEIELLDSEDGRVRNELADENLKNRFIEFHNEKAELRAISRFANLSVVKKEA